MSCGTLAVDCLPIGVREMVHVDRRHPRFSTALEPILAALSPQEADAFLRTWSFTAEMVREVAYASYDQGQMLIVDGAFDACRVVDHVGTRMNTLEIVDESPTRRVGFLGTTRVDVACLAVNRLAVAFDHGAPMMRVLAAVHGRSAPSWLGRLPPATRARVAASPLIAAVALDGRFPLDSEIGLVLSESRWFVVGLDPVDDDQAAVMARGFFDGTLPNGAAANLSALVGAVGASEYGGVFGIREALPALTIEVDVSGAELQLRLEANVVASGLRLLSAGSP